MRTLDTLLKSVATIKRAMLPKPSPVIQFLPSVFLTEDGDDWPGAEESNDVARRWAIVRGMEAKEYIGLGPDSDGSEMI